ncbi:MAG: exonuclease domain-containing protein, partial [Burkholderiaceae bacterium]
MDNSTAPDQSAADSTDASATTANAVATIRPSDDHLIWVDMEMSGLDPESNRILEVAVVVTDGQLNVVA